MDPRRYDLARVGRFMINEKLGIEAPANAKTIRSEDIISVIRHLMLVLASGRRRPTTSTTSATAACGRSASCSRTSSGSA